MSVEHGALLWYGWYIGQEKLLDMYKHTKKYCSRLEDGEDEEWLEEEYESWVYDEQYEHIQVLSYYYDSDYAIGIFFHPGDRGIFEFAKELTKRSGELTEWWGDTFVADYPMPKVLKTALWMDVQTY